MKRAAVFFVLTLLFIMLGCTEKYPVPEEKFLAISTTTGCTDCHLDVDLLKQVATPLPPKPPDSGEG